MILASVHFEGLAVTKLSLHGDLFFFFLNAPSVFFKRMTLNSGVSSRVPMFRPAVGVIRCRDTEEAPEAQEREFPLRCHQSSSSHSSESCFVSL